jgi:hypothetical protein
MNHKQAGICVFRKSLGRKIHYAIDQVGIYQGFAYYIFTAAIAR